MPLIMFNVNVGGYAGWLGLVTTRMSRWAKHGLRVNHDRASFNHQGVDHTINYVDDCVRYRIDFPRKNTIVVLPRVIDKVWGFPSARTSFRQLAHIYQVVRLVRDIVCTFQFDHSCTPMYIRCQKLWSSHIMRCDWHARANTRMSAMECLEAPESTWTLTPQVCPPLTTKATSSLIGS